jgi:hypothetical protein
MKRLLSVVLIAIVALHFTSIPAAMAQSDLRLASLRVGLWPEYDQAALLVIYWGELADTAIYPATVSLRMPVGIVVPNVVAAQPSPDASVDEAEFQNEVIGDWRVITFVTNGPRFQFEYYDSLAQNGDVREPVFVWPGDYAVDVLSIELQQPPHSEDFTTEPILPSSSVNTDDNLTYHEGQYTGLQAGEEFRLQIHYTRSTNDLTAVLLNALQTQASSSSSTLAVSTSSGTNNTDLLLLIGVAAGFFLLGAATMRIAINIQTLNKQRPKH